MAERKKYLPGLIFLGVLWLSLAAACWLKPAQAVSMSERRQLAQVPALNVDTVLSGQFASRFEDYSLDQFPLRDTFRRLKAISTYYVFRQRDNNSIFLADGYAAKLAYPLNEKSVSRAGDKFRQLYDLYLQNTDAKIYFAIVPDKAYFLAESGGYPAMDYDRLSEILQEKMDFARYVDIWGELSRENYYKTDTHWRQETLLPVAETLAQTMGVTLESPFREVETDDPFYGVYCGQAALPLPPEKIRYLTNGILEQCTVYNLETEETARIYDMEKLHSRDPYEMFLSGASPLVVVENPSAKTERELIVFRDSFASSLVPLLAEGYSKITLIDTRYIHPELLGEYVLFGDQDVLFLYSTLLLNDSGILK